VENSRGQVRGKERPDGQYAVTEFHAEEFKMSYLAFDFFLDEVVLAFIVEDDVNLLGAVATDVWPYGMDG
jgi:hypothetical protein